MKLSPIIAIAIAIAAAAAALGSPATARADAIAAGVVVKIDGKEIYVNLGLGQGVVDGAPLRFKRPITLRHPVTHQAVTDWLPIGAATVTSAGEHLAMAQLDDDLRTQLRVGDLAEVYVERAEAAPPPPPAPDHDTTPIPSLDPDTASVMKLWVLQSGQPLDRRIAAWEGWLAGHAESPHAAAVKADLDTLRAEREAVTPRPPTPGVSPVSLRHAAPTHAEAGRAVPLVFVIDDPSRVASASLHFRTAGATTYTRVLLRREHDVYLRGELPPVAVAMPGVEYFVEVARPNGDSGAAWASPSQPTHIDVARAPLVDTFVEDRHRTRLSLMTSYMDFANLDDRKGDRTDQFYLSEVDVLYRLRGVLWGVRAGFGSYGGRGGLANHVYVDREQPPLIGFQYGYAEVELRAPIKDGPPIGGSARLYAGVGNQGFGLGIAARLRLGDPDRANLSVGLQSVQQLGFFSDLRLEAWAERRVPIGISVGVTDQPGSGDLGVRLATDIGWRALSWLQPTLRVSWQGRTAVHSGLGAGAGLVFDW